MLLDENDLLALTYNYTKQSHNGNIIKTIGLTPTTREFISRLKFEKTSIGYISMDNKKPLGSHDYLNDVIEISGFHEWFGYSNYNDIEDESLKDLIGRCANIVISDLSLLFFEAMKVATSSFIDYDKNHILMFEVIGNTYSHIKSNDSVIENTKNIIKLAYSKT